MRVSEKDLSRSHSHTFAVDAHSHLLPRSHSHPVRTREHARARARLRRGGDESELSRALTRIRTSKFAVDARLLSRLIHMCAFSLALARPHLLIRVPNLANIAAMSHICVT